MAVCSYLCQSECGGEIQSQREWVGAIRYSNPASSIGKSLREPTCHRPGSHFSLREEREPRISALFREGRFRAIVFTLLLFLGPPASSPSLAADRPASLQYPQGSCRCHRSQGRRYPAISSLQRSRTSPLQATCSLFLSRPFSHANTSFTFPAEYLYVAIVASNPILRI